MINFRDTIDHRQLEQLYDYWNTIRGDRAMPARSDMDPLDIPTLLAHILLLDVEHAPLRFRVRVFGTAIVASRGADITGHYLDEVKEPPVQKDFIQANRRLTETMAPIVMAAPYPDATDRPSHYHRLGLPLSDDGSRVDMILIGFYRLLSTPAESLPEITAA